MTTKMKSGIVSFVVFLSLCAAPVLGQSTFTVELQGGNVFSPADVTIEVGDTVHWVWVAGNHNVESGVVVSGSGVPDGLFRSAIRPPSLAPRSSWFSIRRSLMLIRR